MIGVEPDAGLGATIAIGCLMHHVDLFLGAHSRHVAIIAHTYQQPASISIGKGRYRLGQLLSIGNTILEILLLMLALTDERL